MTTTAHIHQWLELCDLLRGRVSEVQYSLADLEATRYEEDLAPVFALLTKARAAAHTLFGHITGMEFEAGQITPAPKE